MPRIGKTLVEDCASLSIFVLRRQGCLSSTGENFLYGGDEKLSLTRTPCYFGGTRFWFVCPGCERRVGVLYKPLRHQHFRCRHCYNLTYTSVQVRKTALSEPFLKKFRVLDRIEYVRAGVGQKGYSRLELMQLNRLYQKAHCLGLVRRAC